MSRSLVANVYAGDAWWGPAHGNADVVPEEVAAEITNPAAWGEPDAEAEAVEVETEAVEVQPETEPEADGSSVEEPETAPDAGDSDASEPESSQEAETEAESIAKAVATIAADPSAHKAATIIDLAPHLTPDQAATIHAAETAGPARKTVLDATRPND